MQQTSCYIKEIIYVLSINMAMFFFQPKSQFLGLKQSLNMCRIIMLTFSLNFSRMASNVVGYFRSDEFDWLGHSEREAADRRCCHGDVGRVEEEIVRQQVGGNGGSHDLVMTSLLHHSATVVRSRRSQ